MVRLILYITGCVFRLFKITLAIIISIAYRGSSAQHTADTAILAKQDLIDALDVEIASLEQEKKLYIEQMNSSKTGEEKRVKLQSKVARINTRIMTLSRRVLKLREELENGKTCI